VALEPLAAEADLTARGIDTSNTDQTDALLAAASAAVRGAAGSAITRDTSTVTFWTEASRRVELPAKPVNSVASVTLDGVTVTDYVVRGSSLWRSHPWHQYGQVPGQLVVEFEHGYDEVPADIVDLVCSLVAAGQAAAADGYDPKRGVAYERGDDYGYGMATGSDEVVSPMELPAKTRAWLRRRFGSGASVVGSVR
jgi:hypothetical protein